MNNKLTREDLNIMDEDDFLRKTIEATESDLRRKKANEYLSSITDTMLSSITEKKKAMDKDKDIVSEKEIEDDIKKAIIYLGSLGRDNLISKDIFEYNSKFASKMIELGYFDPKNTEEIFKETNLLGILNGYDFESISEKYGIINLALALLLKDGLLNYDLMKKLANNNDSHAISGLVIDSFHKYIYSNS